MRKDGGEEDHVQVGVWPQTVMMHQWLFNLEFPEMVFVITRSGETIAWTKEKKLSYFEQVQSPNMKLVRRIQPTDLKVDANQMEEIYKTIKEGKDGKLSLALLDEDPLGAFAQAVMKRFTTDDIQVVNAQKGIQDMLQKKDDAEVEQVRRAGSFCCIAMQECVIRKWQDSVDEEVEITHAAFCTSLEETLEDETEIKRLCTKNKLANEELDVPIVMLQSGKKFQLDFAAQATADKLNVSDSGSHILGIAVRCCEYFAGLTRTLMVNPSNLEKQAYVWMHSLHKKVVDLLVDGAVYQDIYRSAKEELSRMPHMQPSILSRFNTNVGFATGLAFREKGTLLEDGCQRKVVVPSTFVVSVGLLPDSDGRGAIWYSETVLVTSGKNEVLTARCASTPKDAFFEIDMADTEEPKAVPATSSTPPPKAAPPAPAKAAPVAKPPAAAPAPVVEPPAARPPAAPRERSRSRGRGPKSKAAPKKAPKEKAAPKAAKATAEAKPKAAAADKKSATTAATPRAEAKVKAQASKPQIKRPEVQSQPTPVRRSARQTPEPTRARSMRSSTVRAKEAINEQAAMDRLQPPLRTKKMEEIRKRFEDGGAAAFGGKGPVVQKRMADYEAYQDTSTVPFRKQPQLRIDMHAEALLVPYKGAIIPFHCKMIKNMNRQESDGEQHLRVNFFFPGQGKAADDFPRGNTKTVYVKELFFKSDDKEIFEGIIKDFKEVQKVSKNRDTELELKAQHSEQSTKAEALKELRPCPSIRDVSMRPSMGSAKSKPVWNLEAHHNGFRCGVRGSATEKLEVLYSQIKVAIFQPCERRSLTVLIHFHLNEPVMVNRRKTYDLQFYTEVRAQTEDLSMRRSANAYDPDEILQEQREEEMKVRLNKVFQDFVVKTQKLPGFKLKFELPTEDFCISGVHFRANSPIFLCTKSMLSVQDWPPLVVHMDEVEIAVFERVTAATREFDMTLIHKDYSRAPTGITMIPVSGMADLKTWFGDIKMVWYVLPMNMQWKAVMQEITSDIGKFIEDGGFQAWFDNPEDEEDDDAAKDNDESDFEAEDSDGEDDFDGEMESDEEPSEESEDEDDDEDDDDDSEFDDDEDGKSWDELEREAEEEERRERGKAKAKAAPPGRPQRNTKRR